MEKIKSYVIYASFSFDFPINLYKSDITNLNLSPIQFLAYSPRNKFGRKIGIWSGFLLTFIILKQEYAESTRLIPEKILIRPFGKIRFWAKYQLFLRISLTMGDVFPWNQLPHLGGSQLDAWILSGRFSRIFIKLSKSQIEYRFLPLPLGFSKRIGASVFGVPTGTVFSNAES